MTCREKKIPSVSVELLYLLWSMATYCKWSCSDSNNSLFYFQRYKYYISKGIPGSALAYQEPEVMDRVLLWKIPEKLRADPDLEPLVNELKSEVAKDYDFSVRKSIGKVLANCCYMS